MTCHWIEDAKEFQKIVEEWDNILLLSSKDNPFLLSDFILTWWKHFSTNLRFCIFVVYQNARIIGGLPLCCNKAGSFRYPGGITANYTELLSMNDNRHLIWRVFLEALEKRKGWQCVRLERYKQSNLDDINVLKAKPSLNNKNMLLDIYESGYTYLINIPENFSGYINCIPKTPRRYIRYSEREFTKLGKILK